VIDLKGIGVPYDRSAAISERHETLLELIESGGRSAAALAEAVGVSQPTINRDLSYLRKKGHAIKARRLPVGWAYELDGSQHSRSTAAGKRA